ncbi:MAG: glycosyltransferase family 2 protein [Acidobacteria bacterium]|nr:glycosyltransferase family 2 protein [Acidobacteriota bacterium]
MTEELLAYLRAIASLDEIAEVIVVDGSDAVVFADFDARCSDAVRHVRVDPDLERLANGKVAGVLTGLRLASQGYLVLADEDVRYDAQALGALRRALDHAEIVRPQNYFDPLPWHACLDTARTLINRVTGGDWPGTFGVRRSALERTGGYDGDVLFENLELVRTVRAAGGRELRPLNLFVRRLPPKTHQFWSQRVRQAYDELARPARLVTWLALFPALIVVIARFRRLGVGTAIVTPMIVAETGRRIGDGVRVFPAVATVAAPLWLLERAVCAWVAIAARFVLGGIPYRGRVLTRAATPYRTLARNYDLKHKRSTERRNALAPTDPGAFPQ